MADNHPQYSGDPETLAARLAALCLDNLHGAVLTAWELIDKTNSEYRCLVRWRNERECGTHFALLTTEATQDQNSHLLWGRYYQSESQSVDSMADFLERSGMAAAVIAKTTA